MEGSCSLKALVSGVCDFSDKDRKRQTGIILLLSCNRKIVNHKSTYKFTGPEYEVDLILCWAAKFTRNERMLAMTICPIHCTKLGLGWSRGFSTRCRVPEGICNHGKGKGTWPKGEGLQTLPEEKPYLKLFRDSIALLFYLIN